MRYFWAAVISAAIFTAGCESKPQAPAAGPGKTEPGETQTKTEPEKKPAVFSLGDMAPKDFNPPATLADLDAKGVQWKANEVLDSYELLKEHLAKEKSALTAADALKLRNSDKESNQKILSALGQLPATSEKSVGMPKLIVISRAISAAPSRSSPVRFPTSMCRI